MKKRHKKEKEVQPQVVAVDQHHNETGSGEAPAVVEEHAADSREGDLLLLPQSFQ
jgi:hypothetical protein